LNLNFELIRTYELNLSEITLNYRKSENCCNLGKSRKNWSKLILKISQNIWFSIQSGKFCKQISKQFSNFDKKLRLEIGAKECCRLSFNFVVFSVVILCHSLPSLFVLSFHFLLFFHSFSSGASTQVHCVDLGESFPTRNIYLQNLACLLACFDTAENEPYYFEISSSREFKLNFEITNRLFATQKTLSGEDTCATWEHEIASKPMIASKIRAKSKSLAEVAGAAKPRTA